MRVLTIALLTLGLTLPAWAQTPAWQFSRSASEGTCTAQLRAGANEIALVALPEGTIRATIRNPNMPHTAITTWQVRGQPWRQLVGTYDASYRAIITEEVSPLLLSELSKGARLDLYLHATELSLNSPVLGTLNLSLAGSAKAISQLQTCNTWFTTGVPTTLVYAFEIPQR